MTPFFETDSLALYLGSAQDVLPKIVLPEHSLAICDPPYGQTSLEWDRWPQRWPSWLPQSVNAMWCFGTMRMFMDHAQEWKTASWRLSQDLVWEKPNGSSFHSDRFRRVHESICHFYRGKWSKVRHSAPLFSGGKKTIRRKKRPTHMGSIEGAVYRSEDGGPRIERSVLFESSTHGYAINPTQKPLDLVKTLLHYSAQPGDTIVCPFAGSGTDLIAAVELGMKAIGIEARETECQAAKERIINHLAQRTLFNPTEKEACESKPT